nr:hypothetical protein [Mycobacterium sp. E3298]
MKYHFYSLYYSHQGGKILAGNIYLDDNGKPVGLNNPLPVRRVGSSDYASYPDLSIGVSPTTIVFPKSMNNIMITNDGTDDVKIGLQGKNPFGTIHDNQDITWSYTGTWVSDTTAILRAVGSDVAKTSTAGSKATYKPNIACAQIAVSIAKGSAAGIAQIEISNDGGNTWANPSSISGVSRSDGFTGTAMDTFDAYTSATAGPYDLIYTLPTISNWSLRVSYTGSKNSSSSGYNVWIDCGKVFTSTNASIVIKSGETLSLAISSGDIQLASKSGTQPVRLVVSV